MSNRSRKYDKPQLGKDANAFLYAHPIFTGRLLLILGVFLFLLSLIFLTFATISGVILGLISVFSICYGYSFLSKKSIFKRWWFWAIVVVFALFVILSAAGGSGDDADKKDPSSGAASASISVDAEASSEESAASNAAVADTEENEIFFDPALGKDIADYDVMFSDSVRNDVTGNWRLAIVSDSALADIENYALSYYMRYFEDDAEVHFIVNFAVNTTTRINCTAGQLFVTVFDYVEDEEHDAKKLPSGEQLASYAVTIEDGTVEELSADGEVNPDADLIGTENGALAAGLDDTSSANPDNTSAQASANIVYVSNSGKIHSSSNCSGMKHYTEMTYDEAISAGYVKCQKCY